MDTSDEGRIWRDVSGAAVVEALNEPESLNFGAVCVNPEAASANRVYRKEFLTKPVFLSDQYELAVANMKEAGAFVLSMNGFSELTDGWLNQHDLEKGKYEESCKAILKAAIRCTRHEFPGARLCLTYGASEKVIDLVVKEVAKDPQFNLSLLGFSCPRYMLYTADDNIPVYVSKSADQYSDAYVRSLDLLITTGGRKRALMHDVYAACVYRKRIHFIDVMNILTNGKVPSTIKKHDGTVEVENAPAAFGFNISSFTMTQAISTVPANGDVWNSVFANVGSVAVEVCRRTMPPSMMFKP